MTTIGGSTVTAIIVFNGTRWPKNNGLGFGSWQMNSSDVMYAQSNRNVRFIVRRRREAHGYSISIKVGDSHCRQPLCSDEWQVFSIHSLKYQLTRSHGEKKAASPSTSSFYPISIRVLHLLEWIVWDSSRYLRFLLMRRRS